MRWEHRRAIPFDAALLSLNNEGMKSSAGSRSSGNDFGLLLLRIFLGGSLFLKHGLEKITHFSRMSAHFPNPIHIGSHASLIYALISDAICSLLTVLGLGTRAAACIIVINLGVVFCLVEHYAFWAGHGELVVVYFGGFLALMFAGAGRFSLDWKFWGRS